MCSDYKRCSGQSSSPLIQSEVKIDIQNLDITVTDDFPGLEGTPVFLISQVVSAGFVLHSLAVCSLCVGLSRNRGNIQ